MTIGSPGLPLFESPISPALTQVPHTWQSARTWLAPNGLISNAAASGEHLILHATTISSVVDARGSAIIGQIEAGRDPRCAAISLCPSAFMTLQASKLTALLSPPEST